MRYAWHRCFQPARATAAPARDRARARRARPARLPQPRPRRRTSATDRSVEALRARTFEVLDAAYAAGVRYFDAARSYGRGEEFLGAWLRDRATRRTCVVGSKWGYVYTAGWEVDADPPEVKHHDVETLAPPARARRASSSATGSTSTRSTPPRRTAACSRTTRCSRELRELRATGVAIGVSVERHRRRRRRSTARVALGVLRRRPGDLEPARARRRRRRSRRAHDAGLEVIVKEALANGRLGPRGAAPGSPRVADRARRDAGRGRARRGARAAVRRHRAERRGDARRAREQPRRRDARAPRRRRSRSWRALEEDSDEYWNTRSALPWN